MKQLTRIDKLAKQAWGFAYNTKHDYKTEHDAYTNKLAELIVRECAEYITEYFPHSRYEARQMKKYLGVEE